MPLFHASTEQYAPGVTVRKHASPRNALELESLMEALRPSEKRSRVGACFAFKNPVYARMYLEGEHVLANSIHIYQVAMDAPTIAAMPLVDHAARAQHIDDALTKEIIAAYWTSAAGWNLIEHFGPTMTIIRELPSLDVFSYNMQFGKAFILLEQDQQRARQLFPITKRM